MVFGRAKQGRVKEAESILSKVNGAQNAKIEIAEINEAISTESDSITEVFKPGLRKALVIGITLAILSQVTGINAIMYYAPEIFKSTGDSSNSALLQTVLIGAVHVIFTLVAIKYVDKVGRKGLLLGGSAGMAFCLAVIGAAFFLGFLEGYLILIFILLYIAFFAISLGPLTFVVIAEIFPNRTRGRAMSIALFSLWAGVFLVSQLFPILLETIGSAFTFWIFMFMAVITCLFVWKVIPETKGRTLEEIEKSWAH